MPLRGLFKKKIMNIIEKLISYLRSSKHELTKVTWPSKQTTTRYSILVITISIIVAIFFGLLDYGLAEVVNITILQRLAKTRVLNQTTPIVPTTVPLDATETKPEFDFGNIELEPENSNTDINIETLPIEE